MFGALAVLLTACTIGGVQAKCGLVTVPENRAQPAGAQIALNVAVLPALQPSARRADPVFYITGGPGGVDTEVLPYIATTFPEVNAHRDVVFVDQRGVGGSNPLTCKLATLTTSVEAVVAACLGQTTADLTHYRTTDAMDDLDAVRQALGYDRIDVWGGSYGATAVQVYVRRHPDTVRTFVIDGPTLLDVPVLERWASSAQRALDLLHKRCHAQRACAKAFPAWYERFPALLAKLAQKPVRVGTLTVDAAFVAGTIDELTATVQGATDVPFLLTKAEGGNLNPLVVAYYRITAGQSEDIQLMPWAIMCTEPWAVQDPARVDADSARSYLRYGQPASARFAQQVCGAWPKVDTSGEDWSRVQTDLPGLVLVGGADPKDPPANTAGVTQVMPNAKVIVVPGGAHGVAHEGCVPLLVDRFFERGTTAGLDTRCAAKALVPYPSFRLR